jgi:RodZ C-terminal domain
VPESKPQPAFDERAVLAELENLHRAIQQSRQQREQAVARFDSFVRAFREPEKPPALSPAPAATLPPSAPTPPVRGSEQPARVDVVPVPAEAPPRKSGVPYVAAAVIGGLLVAGFLLGRSMMRTPTATAPAAEAPKVETPSQAPAPAAPSVPAPATPARAVRVELTTLRQVWLRVIVDDVKTMERVVEADQRIPLEADRAVVVRAGDGGAVRITTGGSDGGLMGVEGQPITRTFAAQASPVAK